MVAFKDFRWFEDLVLPLLILVPPMIWVVYQADKADNLLPMLPLPIVALGVGLALRPRHVWLIWLGSVAMEWVIVIAMGNYNDPGTGETLSSIMIEAFIWMLMGVLVPVWLGRLIRAARAGNLPGQNTPTA